MRFSEAGTSQKTEELVQTLYRVIVLKKFRVNVGGRNDHLLQTNCRCKETHRGALIQISTKNAEALEAIHNFLRFQMTGRRTQ